MNRNVAFFFLSSSLLFSGCATHTRTAAPVVVKVSSETASKAFLNEIRDTTAPNARPMTINVKIDVATQTKPLPGLVASVPNPQHAVATLSPDPMSEAAPPTVSDNRSAFTERRVEEVTAYRAGYTITDAAGRVLESNTLTLENGHLVNTAIGAPLNGRHGPMLRYDLVNDTARFLASRVKTLSR